LSSDTHFDISHDADIISARKRIRKICSDLGFSSADMLKQGRMSISEVSDEGKRGVLIVAHDSGPGITDLALAMEDGYSTGNTLGYGLPGAKRLMDEFAIESKVGEGTQVRMIKWKRTERR
jgi:serine/threonine-protein kinase RsbT